MVDISDLPLVQFANGSLFAGGDDLARMEQALGELRQKRDAIEAKVMILPEHKKRQLATIDREIGLLTQAIIAQKEFVRLDPDRDRDYVAMKDEIAAQAREAELEKSEPKPKKSGWGPGSWFGGGSGAGDISGR